ncbi:MAG TPA: hypothetical protein VMD79_05000 [Solirubrobacteraceae bacterium]|nr:hypothetical protein [Solirubrobacteraceae bacterium]
MFAAVAHWHSESDLATSSTPTLAPQHLDRSQILFECVASLLDLDVDRVVVAVLTNQASHTARELSSRLPAGSGEPPVSVHPHMGSFELQRAGARQIAVIGWRPGLMRRHGFYLTWAHKPLFRRVLGDPGFSHLIYLEDDIRFTRESLAYWCRFREPLARHGLLPGFVRYESLGDARYLPDHRRRQQVDRADRQCLVLREPLSGDASTLDLRFVSLENPYQAMYVLDRGLASDHLWRSPARSPLLSRTIRWPNNDIQWRAALIRERAALGPILDEVPPGFGSRNVVPAQMPRPGQYRLDPACLIEHLAANKVPSFPTSQRILVEDMFLDTSGDAQLAGLPPGQ